MFGFVHDLRLKLTTGQIIDYSIHKSFKQNIYSIVKQSI